MRTDPMLVWMRRLAVLAVVCAALLSAPARAAGCLADGALRGVNLAGAEFNGKRLPGVRNKDYVYPDRAAFDYFAALGMNAVRLPFRWERVQPTLFGELDAAEAAEIGAAVNEARARGMCIILDVHNYGLYHGQPIGSADVPAAAFVDLWQRLAGRFADADSVALGLMNEPFKLSIDDWSTVAQRTVDALRQSGARHLVLVSGGRWSGVHEWHKTFGATSNARAFADFQDPLKRTLIEVHQYADRNHSGTGTQCVASADLVPMFDAIAEWAHTHRQTLFLGEFGTASDRDCLEALGTLLAQTRDTQVWRGWTYWAAGKWWGGYPLSIEPKNGRDAAQTAVLKRYL